MINIPVHSCTKDGKPGYQWGGQGKCYTYESGNESSRNRAKKKAEAQGRAAHASGYQGSSKKELLKEIQLHLSKLGVEIRKYREQL